MGARRSTVAGVSLAVVAALAAAGCSSNKSSTASSSAVPCFPKPAAASTAAASGAGPAGATGAVVHTTAAQGGSNPAVAAGWTLPGADLANTRDVASAITSANVATLGKAWTSPLQDVVPGLAGYATTPIVMNGVMYTQDLQSNVSAINLATGHVLWTHDYHSDNGGPDGVTVASGVVYATTTNTVLALDAATGRQVWSRKITANNHEGIDMAPGYNHGTLYVSTVPVNPTVGEYLGGGKGILWALNAQTGAPEWTWDEVQNLWGMPSVNSGGGLWDPPTFDAQGNLYIGIANPGPLGGTAAYPLGTSRPGPDLYTDSVVKLSPQGKLLWYYQLTPHDLFDWDLQDSPVLTTSNGQQVVIDGGKAGILVELNAQTGKLIWKLPVGVHEGPANAGLLTEYAKAGARSPLPAKSCLEPGAYGGIESQLATNGSTTFVPVNDLPMQVTSDGSYYEPSTAAGEAAVDEATGEMVAVNQDTGKVSWDDKLPSSAYGAAAVTNDVVFTTTYNGYLYAFSTTTGQVLLKLRLPDGTNAPVTISGDYVITGAGLPRGNISSAAARAKGQTVIIAYKLGAAS
jgi:outer membrane protein assembly factor BamB